jgi:hypothetical protein
MEKKQAALRSGACFLSSAAEYKKSKNFTNFIGKDALAKFEQAQIEAPASQFKGKDDQCWRQLLDGLRVPHCSDAPWES